VQVGKYEKEWRLTPKGVQKKIEMCYAQGFKMRVQSQLKFRSHWKNRSNAEIAFHITAYMQFGQLKNLSNVAILSQIGHILRTVKGEIS